MSNRHSDKWVSGNKPFPVKGRSPLIPMIVLFVLVTVVVGVLGVLQLRHTYTQTLSTAKNTGSMLAGTLQQTISSMIQKTDMTVRSVVDEVTHQSAAGGVQSGRIGTFIERQFQQMPELDSLRITNSQGVVVSGSGHVPTVAVTLIDRDYFLYLRDHPDAGLIISKPIIGKISKKRVIVCARRITQNDGTFGGIAYAVLPLELFEDLFKGVPIGSRGSITLRSDDFTLIIRYSPLLSEKNDAAAGTDVISQEWRTLIAQGHTKNATYTADSSADGLRRIYSYHRIASYPLYVNVGLALEDVLKETWVHIRIVTGTLLLLLVTAAMLVWQVYRNWQKADALKRNYARLELIQEVSQYQAASVQDLLDFALGRVIALTESSIGYIYNYHEEQQQFVLNSWSKGVMAACQVAEPQTIYQLDKTGIWGEVVRQRRPVTVNDFAAPSELKKGYPEGHVHLARFLSIPVFDNDRIVAVVGVANKILPYDQTDVLQLTLMMEGVWKIAARLTMEERISQVGQEWQTTFDSISDSIALLDADQRIVRCNRASRKLVGREFKDIIGQPCWKLFHNTDAPVLACPMEQVKSSRHSETATIQHNDRWLEVTVDPLLSASGELTGAVHIVRDVTEQITLLNSLKDLNELFNLFMKYSPIYCYIKEIIDSESRVVQASENFVELVNFRASEMIGKNMHQLFPQEFADRITADDLKAVTEQKVLRLEEELDGKSYIIYKFPIQNSAGKKILADYTVDITELKQSEETVRAVQQQLMQNDKLATIGQLAAGVAHEINNPMGFVSSNMITLGKYIEKYHRYIELLEQDICAASGEIFPEHLREARNTMKLDYVFKDINILLEENNEGLERVKRIVKDLKIFSRSDTFEIASADLNNSIDSTINIVINEIKYAAKLKLNYGHLPKIACNIQQISQVLMNLLINAAHAIQAKGDEVGEITICTWCDQENVYVSVSDTGCGIPPDHLGKIFDAFFTTKDVGKGTGLGLSISSEIIRKHGGEITVASETAVGSTFTVRLPLNQ